MISENDPNIIIGVDEANEGGTPTNRWGDVQEGKNAYLEHDKPEEYDVDELDHFWVGVMDVIIKYSDKG